MKRTLCAVGLGALCLTWVASAGATVLCAKKSGVVVVRAACKKKETPLNLTQFGAVSLPCASQVGTEVFFTGCNVNIRSGSGSTDGAVNGLGGPRARAAEHQPGQRRAAGEGARRRARGAVTPRARDEVAET